MRFRFEELHSTSSKLGKNVRTEKFTPRDFKKKYPEDYKKFVSIWKELGEDIEESDRIEVTFSDDERIVAVRADTQL